MVLVISGLAVLVAIASWVVVLISALAIVGIVPRGQRWRAWFAMGAWRMREVRELGGAAVEPHLKRYQLGFLCFFAAIIILAGVTILLGGAQQSGTLDVTEESASGA